MANVKAPLMSLDASGQLAKTLIYSRNKGRHTVKTFAAPDQPNTEQQIATRLSMANANKLWPFLTDQQKENWKPHDENNVGPQPTYLSDAITRIFKNEPAITIPTGTPPTPLPIWDYIEYYQVGNTLHIEGQSTGDPFNLYHYIWWSLAPGVPLAPNSLILAQLVSQGQEDQGLELDLQSPIGHVENMKALITDAWGNQGTWEEVDT